MKAFVVSLARATERREYISAHLKSLNIDFEIINAVDYKELSEEDFNVLSDQEAVKRNPWLSQGMIACALSHVKIYGMIAEGDDEVVLVLEDDATLPPNILELLAEAEKNIQEDEVISLSYYNHFDNTTYLSKQGAVALKNNNQLLYPNDLNSIASTMAYVIRRGVAAKMHKLLMPISIQPDYWGNFYEKGAFNSFRCLYPMQTKAAAFRTTLNYADASSWKGKAAALVREYKIPVLYQFLEKRRENILKEKYQFVLTDELPFNQKK